jgi:hypothetical protein
MVVVDLPLTLLGIVLAIRLGRQRPDDQPRSVERAAGVYWLNLRTDPNRPRKSAKIGLSSIEWIGSRYRQIGSPPGPSTDKHWKALRS